MYILYNLLLMVLTIVLFPYILFRVITVSKYRGGITQKLGRVRKRVLWVIRGTERPIWVHAVSVGEVMAAHPLIRDLRKRYPRKKLILSTVTVTGNYTARQRVPEADAVFYFPFDYPWIVRRVIRRIKPAIVIVAETELWPNFLRELKKAGIPSVVVNGRISPHSYRNYMKLKWFFREVFRHVDLFCMQSDADAKRITEIGAEPGKVAVTGNLKFDQKITIIRSQPLSVPPGSKIITAGSTHRGEESVLLDVFRRLRETYPRLLLILAPRHPERFNEVEGLINAAGFDCQRRTTMSGEVRDVLLLDTIGELRSFYAICDIAFVGGSLVKVGGHNLLEPAAMKKPIIFSRYMYNFKEISEAIMAAGGGLIVKDKGELYTQMDNLLSNEELSKKIGQKAYEVIAANSGATVRTLEAIGRIPFAY
ncbi:MAG TPA: 3-deoxy-D-manno-octulosonic acid transferase [Nitrospirota bacterium]|nr:3-deoxy-D-manno-octulosonic acid transferase [Nitrospirota bacterium]